MISVPLSFQAYAPGASGVPGIANPLIPVSIESYTHSISATGGFEACNVSFSGTLDDATYWLGNLMANVICYGPDAQTCWEGFLSTVEVDLGHEKISLSIDDMANAVAVKYQPDIGQQATTAFSTDTNSIALYGRRDLVYGGSGMTATAATTLRDTLLAARAYPVSRRSSVVATGQRSSQVSISLQCTGWYYALGWLTTSSSTTATAVTTTQVGTLLTSYNSTNNFFSTATTDIAASGLSDTQYIEANTPYRTKIERLLSLGNSSGERIAYGVYEAQTFRAATWAAATPDAITYRRYLADGAVYNAYGGRLDYWDIRPDAMYQTVDLLGASGPISQDGIATYYIERVTCSADSGGVSVKLEPARSSELDVLLARIRN